MTNFTKKEIDIIREMMFVGISCQGVDIYLDSVSGKKEVEANKILYYYFSFAGIFLSKNACLCTITNTGHKHYG